MNEENIKSIVRDMVENGELTIYEDYVVPILPQSGYSGNDQWQCSCGKWHSMIERCIHLKIKNI